MIAPNYSKFCVEAEHYYLDFLLDETAESVPNETINHIIGCTHCREQMSRLEKILNSQTNFSQQSKAITSLLKLHLSYAGRQVTCANVRPFLPGLLNPALQIEIPTPITVHIDKCEQCRRDLETLKSLRLNPRNLVTLSQMFADDLAVDESQCIAARSAIPSVAAMSFNQTDTKTIRHLCLCPQCRDKLYKFREMIQQQTTSQRDKDKIENNQLYCPSVTFNDIFDYCIPYSIDPADDEYEKFRSSLTSHIICCADCLSKLQQLHKTIYSIVDKPESGIATIFHLDTSAETAPQTESDNLYAGFHIKLETVNYGSVQAGVNMPCIEKAGTPVKMKPISKNFRPLFKVALPVAALIIVGISLLLRVPFAKATSIEQIREAVLRIKNVHIMNFSPGRAEPIQEKWASRQQGIFIMKSGDKLAIWNVNQGIHKTLDSKLNKTEQATMLPEETTQIAETINGTLGLMPLEDMTVLPKDAQWNQLTDTNITPDASALEVYDLLWFESSSSTSKKWRVYVDPQTKLPRRTEFYRKRLGEDTFILKLFIVLDYPTDEGMKETIEKLSF
jgi:hypothetical protein